MIRLLLATLLFSATAAGVSAQEAPGPAAAPPQAAPLTWEDLPASLRALLEPRIGQTPVQSVLTVTQAAPVDAATRTVDHGDLLFAQTVTPGRGARLLADASRKQYGTAGAELFPVRTPEGEVFCRWHETPRSLLVTSAGMLAPTAYCWRDRDGDGRFDALYENNGVTARGPYPGSRFQIRSLGRNEGLKAPMPYERIGGAPPIQDVVALRYVGPVAGAVAADGKVTDGLLAFELVTGPDVKTLQTARKLGVPLDAQGRGRLQHRAGITVEVEGADVDGTARLRLVSALPTGEVLLSPPLTREDAVELVTEMLAAGRLGVGG